MCGCLSCTPSWGPGLQPRHVSWLRIKPATLWFVGQRPVHWTIPARANLHISREESYPQTNQWNPKEDKEAGHVTNDLSEQYCLCHFEEGGWGTSTLSTQAVWPWGLPLSELAHEPRMCPTVPPVNRQLPSLGSCSPGQYEGALLELSFLIFPCVSTLHSRKAKPRLFLAGSPPAENSQNYTRCLGNNGAQWWSWEEKNWEPMRMWQASRVFLSNNLPALTCL